MKASEEWPITACISFQHNCVTLFQLIKCFKVETVGNAVVQLQFELFQVSNGSVTVFSIFHMWQSHDSDEDSEQ